MAYEQYKDLCREQLGSRPNGIDLTELVSRIWDKIRQDANRPVDSRAQLHEKILCLIVNHPRRAMDRSVFSGPSTSGNSGLDFLYVLPERRNGHLVVVIHDVNQHGEWGLVEEAGKLVPLMLKGPTGGPPNNSQSQNQPSNNHSHQDTFLGVTSLAVAALRLLAQETSVPRIVDMGVLGGGKILFIVGIDSTSRRQWVFVFDGDPVDKVVAEWVQVRNSMEALKGADPNDVHVLLPASAPEHFITILANSLAATVYTWDAHIVRPASLPKQPLLASASPP